ncbi:PGF-CTERM-anchored ABC transporter substrate-binding protein [Halorubrum vacuolatum]|uniref:Iron complex transport system substrate-binding protein n=1 Tax=Halorubrum vacuolatum TaxID=63740 RepID=A0A238VFS1_HALVU|nr:PGF-CTERM-anchored ABC transporter substrate-binding protein [Halorubrum vacuolatum]SNR32359.1 iron complex transport system substrate-binding protein [Halorubrum vacuolatum]
MTRINAILVAAIVVTALVGGTAGVATGSGPSAIVAGDGADADVADIDGGANGLEGGEATADTTAPTCEFPLTITDATGEELTIEEPPERIVTTNPSAAQVLWEFGVEDRVVGVTQFAAYLDGAAEKQDVSAEFGIDRELVADADPDLILAPNASAEDVEPLRNDGHTVYHFTEAKDVDDIADKTDTIGKVADACAEAEETNTWMYEEVETVEERTAEFDRPAALYPLGDGFVVAGDTFTDEIMTIGGTDNVAAAEHTGYPQLSDEVVIEADPELILVTGETAGIIDEEPYAQTTAGIEGNTVEMEVHYLNQPAPRSVVESTRTLADAAETYQEVAADDEGTDEDDVAEATPEPDDDAEAAPEPDDDATDVSAPGFGVGVTALAVFLATVGAILLGRR